MLYRHLDIDAVGMGCNAAFPFDKGVLKMKKITYPADYAVLSNEEMTYTTGGGAVDNAAGFASTAATVVGAVVLASSYVWGIGQARTWLQQEGNRDGNFFTVFRDLKHAFIGDVVRSANTAFDIFKLEII